MCILKLTTWVRYDLFYLSMSCVLYRKWCISFHVFFITYCAYEWFWHRNILARKTVYPGNSKVNKKCWSWDEIDQSIDPLTIHWVTPICYWLQPIINRSSEGSLLGEKNTYLPFPTLPKTVMQILIESRCQWMKLVLKKEGKVLSVDHYLLSSPG